MSPGPTDVKGNFCYLFHHDRDLPVLSAQAGQDGVQWVYGISGVVRLVLQGG